MVKRVAYYADMKLSWKKHLGEALISGFTMSVEEEDDDDFDDDDNEEWMVEEVRMPATLMLEGKHSFQARPYTVCAWPTSAQLHTRTCLYLLRHVV
jgi:hypothetical protein